MSVKRRCRSKTAAAIQLISLINYFLIQKFISVFFALTNYLQTAKFLLLKMWLHLDLH